MLIINGLRTKVQSVDKIKNQANRGGQNTQSIHCALRFGGGVRGVGACICWCVCQTNRKVISLFACSSVANVR